MNNVKALRQQAGLSQQQLAKRAECSQPTISAIESGRGTNVRIAGRIAEALKKPLKTVFP